MEMIENAPGLTLRVAGEGEDFLEKPDWQFDTLCWTVWRDYCSSTHLIFILQALPATRRSGLCVCSPNSVQTGKLHARPFRHFLGANNVYTVVGHLFLFPLPRLLHVI